MKYPGVTNNCYFHVGGLGFWIFRQIFQHLFYFLTRCFDHAGFYSVGGDVNAENDCWRIWLFLIFAVIFCCFVFVGPAAQFGAREFVCSIVVVVEVLLVFAWYIVGDVAEDADHFSAAVDEFHCGADVDRKLKSIVFF